MKDSTDNGMEGTRDVPILKLSWDVLEEVINNIGRLPAESGGVLGGKVCTDEIHYFHFDKSGSTTSVSYSPDHDLLNRLFDLDWNPRSIRFKGFIHSHPGCMNSPSYGDRIYADRILKANDDLNMLWIPIVNTIPDTGQFRLTPWVVRRDGSRISVQKGLVHIINCPSKSTLMVGDISVLDAVRSCRPLDDIIIGSGERHAKPNDHSDVMLSTKPAGRFDRNETFNRVQGAYDLELMNKSRVIAVGAGGASDWLEQLARAGLGQFILIDPDVVSESNLATQQTYRKDIGRAKVECIAERIRDINPSAKVLAFRKNLDYFTDEEIRRLASGSGVGERPNITIICGLTDDFLAQARVNRLALKYGLPSLCAQVYKEGRGAEITFTYPGITPACHRCILSTRYEQRLKMGDMDNVTSHGTPIFATSRLNALKGYIFLALLHHGSSHERWGRMLERIGKRNLLQIRLDPDFTARLDIDSFDRVFEKADHQKLFFDEVIWKPQDHECSDTGYGHACPDCGGTGDLRNAIGTIADTRLIIQSSKT